MSSENDPTPPVRVPVKPDLVTAPTLATLVACVLAAIGNRDQSALLTWQLPVGLVLLSLVYVGFRARRARR